MTADISEKRPRSIVQREFYDAVAVILRSARSNAYRAVNFAMVEAYWNVGRMIVEEEQKGKERAEYGHALLANLSRRLADEFGKGFSEPNLRNFRQFYLLFPIRYTLCSESGKLDTQHDERSQIRDSLRPELTWSHYRLLLRVDKPEAREWYMNEAASQNSPLGLKVGGRGMSGLEEYNSGIRGGQIVPTLWRASSESVTFCHGLIMLKIADLWKVLND